MKNTNQNSWAVIINPKSGKKKDESEVCKLLNLLDQNKINYVHFFTERAGHATEIVMSLIEKGHDSFLIVGGDGTVNEVVNGVLKSGRNEDVLLGIIPLGTGNDWARYWDIKPEIEHSFQIFLHRNIVSVDAGFVLYSVDNKEEKRGFVNSVGFGIDAAVAAAAHRHKQIFGSHSMLYFFALIRTLFTYRSQMAAVTFNGDRKILPFYTMNIANGCYSGGGMKQNPNANPTDGIFDGMMVRKPSLTNIFEAVFQLFNGKLLRNKAIESFRSARVVLETSHMNLVETDGIAFVAGTRVEVEILPSALRMIVPENQK